MGGGDSISPVKLNLGCGHKHMPGFINCDFESNWADKQPDVACDVTKTLPFPDNYADEIHAYHLLEHIWRWKVEDTLTDWIRVLKPGGVLVLEMPCLDKIIGIFAHCLLNGIDVEPKLTQWGLYGDPNYHSEEMTHKWAWSVGELEMVLDSLGMKEITESQPTTHHPIRDMRMTSRKTHETHD